MVEPPLIEPPLKQRRVSYPDEELFVSPLYCMKVIAIVVMM
jgi:hypothetical protein